MGARGSPWNSQSGFLADSFTGGSQSHYHAGAIDARSTQPSLMRVRHFFVPITMSCGAPRGTFTRHIDCCKRINRLHMRVPGLAGLLYLIWVTSSGMFVILSHTIGV